MEYTLNFSNHNIPNQIFVISFKRKIIKLAKQIAPRCLKDSFKSSLGNSGNSPYHILIDGDSHLIKLEQDTQIYSTEAASFDFHHIFEDDFHEVSSFINLAKDKTCFLDVGQAGVYTPQFLTSLTPMELPMLSKGLLKVAMQSEELAKKNMITGKIKVNECMVGDRNGKDYFSGENCGYVQILENEPVNRIERDIITLDSYCRRKQPSS